MDINLKILDFLIDLIEIYEISSEKNKMVKDQNYSKAAKLYTKQKEIEKRLMSSDELKKIRDKIISSK